MKLVLALVVGLIVSLLTVSGIKRLAARFRIGSLPSPRKIHSDFKPLLGGLGFFTGIVGTALTAQLSGLIDSGFWLRNSSFWAGLVIILFTGLWDDIKGLSSRIKFSGEAVAAILLIIGGCRIESFTGPLGEVFSLGAFGLPFTFLWIIFIINAVNLMDGLDGLAGGVSFIITAGFAFVAVNSGNLFLLVLTIGLLGGLLGFLRYNSHPASIFMGDVGSLQLGYILAFFSIESLKIASTHQVYFLASLVLLGVPITDTFVSFLRRLGQGQSPFLADKQHIHHRLINLGLTHPQTVWMLYIFTAFYVAAGVLMIYFREFTGLILFLIVLIFSLFWVWRLGYVETRFSMQSSLYQFQQAIPVRRRAPLHFHRLWHKLLLVCLDIIFLNLALYLTYWLKFASGLFAPPAQRPISDYFSTPVFLLITIGWVLLFFVNNLYHMDWDVSRFDKIWRVSKIITFGIVVLGFLTADFEHLASSSQMYSIIIYWALLLILVNGGRLMIIELEKRLKIFEYSPKKTLIIGCNDIGKNVLQDIGINPHLIFDIIGFVSKKMTRKEFLNLPVLGDYNMLPELIHQYKIEEVILALPEGATEDFVRLISLCEAQQVKIKTPPGLHEIFMGQQVSLVSHAYLQVFPENMVLWQWILKRLFDIVASLSLIILLLPLYLLFAVIIRLTFKKSVLLKIPIMGKNGIPFQMYVFRITYDDYDYRKKPVYLGHSVHNTRFKGMMKFMYKYRIYKLPQIFNVLLGDMSFVGPRPEPPEWYSDYYEKLRFIHRRISVRPGLTGLAQVKYHYELSHKVLQERIKFDIFYVENMSVRMDIRILLRSLLLVFKKQAGLPLQTKKSL